MGTEQIVEAINGVAKEISTFTMIYVIWQAINFFFKDM